MELVSISIGCMNGVEAAPQRADRWEGLLVQDGLPLREGFLLHEECMARWCLLSTPSTVGVTIHCAAHARHVLQMHHHQIVLIKEFRFRAEREQFKTV